MFHVNLPGCKDPREFEAICTAHGSCQWSVGCKNHCSLGTSQNLASEEKTLDLSERQAWKMSSKTYIHMFLFLLQSTEHFVFHHLTFPTKMSHKNIHWELFFHTNLLNSGFPSSAARANSLESFLSVDHLPERTQPFSFHQTKKPRFKKASKVLLVVKEL